MARGTRASRSTMAALCVVLLAGCGGGGGGGGGTTNPGGGTNNPGGGTLDPNATLSAVTIAPSAPTILLQGTLQLTANGTFSDGSTRDVTSGVTWTTSDAEIVTLASGGLATAEGVGSATVTATHEATGRAGTVTVTIVPQISSIAVAPSTFSLPIGFSRQLAATATFSDGIVEEVTTAVAWSSSNPAVASVASGGATPGLVTAVAVGTATITATDSASNVAASATVTVTAATLTGVSVSTATPTIPAGVTAVFVARGSFSDGSTHVDVTPSLAWSSEDPAIATVSDAPGSKGLATGVSPGVTHVVAAGQGQSDDAALEVLAATLQGLEVLRTSAAGRPFKIGVSIPLTARGTYSTGAAYDLTRDVAWSSSDPTVARVSTLGVVTALKPGTATITARDPETGIADDLELTALARKRTR